MHKFALFLFPLILACKPAGAPEPVGKTPPKECPGPTCKPDNGDLWGKCKADQTCNSPALTCKVTDKGNICVGQCGTGLCTTKDCGIVACRPDGLCAPSCPCQPGMTCVDQNLCVWN